MIELIESLKLAGLLLKDLQRDKRSKKVDAYVKVYDNGREQGYMLKVSHKKNTDQLTIAFSEWRGSDEIVVYNSKVLGDGSGSMISDEFYKSKKFFDWDCREDARDYIFSLIETFQKEE